MPNKSIPTNTAQHARHFVFRKTSTNAAITPTITNVNPNAPHNAIEFANIGNGIVIFATGFHGNPVNIHSRAHKTNAHTHANNIARPAPVIRIRAIATNGHENISAPAIANPTTPGIVQIANRWVNSGTT